MNFASTHVYNYDHSDEEIFDEHELEQGMRSPGPGLSFGQSNLTYDLHIGDSPPDSMPSASPPDAPYDRLRSPPPRKAVSLSYDNIRPGTPHLRANTESKYDNLSPLPTDPPPPKPPRRKKKKKKGKESTIEEDAELAGYAEPYDVPRKPNLYASIGEGGAALKPPPLPNRPESHLHDKKGGKKYQCRRADTNVISVKFDTLVKPSHMHTGDSVTCEGCGAVLSHLSILTDSGDGGKIWKCEFCEHINRVDIMDGEIPKKDDVTYMLQPSPGTTDPAGYFGDDSIIIFVMDVSGSMCVTTPVPGKFPLRANDSTRALELYNTSPDTDQYMPSERRGTTYVSRLQAMQSAVDHNLSKLCKDCSTKRIGLVSFNNEVTVIGDGSDTPITLAGDKLYDKENLISFGSQLPLPMFIKETRNVLADKIFNLEEGGQTALGPSLLVSVAMASQKAGSKVIICTDGKANIGLGSLEAEEDDMAYDTAAMFYEDLGTYARDKGVCVSVLTLQGTDCRMVELGNVADKTGGQINIVDPLKLKDQFGLILNDPIIATNVTAKLQLHRGLYFRNEETGPHESQAHRTIGNVTAETEITFEFGVKKKSDLQRAGQNVVYDNQGGTVVEAGAAANKPLYDVSSSSVADAQQSALQGVERLPFQLQIQYTSRDEAQCLRVITQDRPVTNDRDLVEDNLNAAVYSAHTAQTTAALAMEGEYTHARLQTAASHNLMKRHAVQKNDSHSYEAFMFNIAPMSRAMAQQQKVELNVYGQNLSEDEDVYGDVDDCESKEVKTKKTNRLGFLPKKKSKKTLRHKAVSDTQANAWFKMKSASSDMF